MLSKDSQTIWDQTASALTEALPYIQAHSGKVIVIKLGGAALADPESLARFALDATLIRQCGIQPIIVHGGGPQINAMLKRLDIEIEFDNGHRVTNAEVIEIVEMVLAGTINKQVVSAIQQQGGQALGISGKDSGLIQAEKMLAQDGTDIGFVGTPRHVDTHLLKHFLESDFIPVIAPIACGLDHTTYNVNADIAAGAIASAMNAKRLMLLTDVSGVQGINSKVIQKMTLEQAERLIADRVITQGMIPKVRTAGKAVKNGVQGAVILDGRTPHAVILELLTNSGAGTLIQS